MTNSGALDAGAISRELCRYLAAELLDPDVVVTPETELRSLDIDSYTLMELLLHLERTIGRTLSADALSSDHLRSVRTLADYVCRP